MKRHPFHQLFLLFFLLCPLLSHASLKDQSSNFLVISDIHLDYASSHAMTINPFKGSEENDLDKQTFYELIEQVNHHINNGMVTKPKFIIVLGDIVGHMRAYSDCVIESQSIVFKTLRQKFPDTPIFYTFGNNDSLAANYGPFQDPAQFGRVKSPYEVAKFNGWINGFLSNGAMCSVDHQQFPCLITENAANGYYAAYLAPQLRLISLNSVMFSPNRNKISVMAATDQLNWLEAQLKAANKEGESVLIAMHIPPGNNVYDHSNFWLASEQTIFLKIINRYQENIIGLLASHTHAEEIKVIKDAIANKMTFGIYLTAALSTSHGNQPSIKTFYLKQHKMRWALTNYKTFHFSVENSRLIFNDLYDYKNYYCAVEKNELSQCLDQLTLNKMKKYYTAGNPNYEGIIKSPDDIVLTSHGSQGY